MYQPVLLLEMIAVQRKQEEKWDFSWCHWLITERQKVSQQNV